MLYFQSIILGIVQGIAEFIPISSSAHLVVIPWLLGWNGSILSSLSFDIALHLGTLLAVLIFFGKDWFELIRAWVKSLFSSSERNSPKAQLAWMLILATIPGGLAGFMFEDTISKFYHGETIPQNAMFFMAGAVILLATALYIADRIASHNRAFNSITIKDALGIGFAQALAIIPGVSRSGATITAGLALGLEREAAARFSFLLSAPIIAGAGAKSLYDLAQLIQTGNVPSQELIAFPIGFAAAAISGLLSIRFLISYLKKHSAKIFVYYRIGFALLIIVAAFMRS